ncbi:isopenicillin N synthase family dioxygenase [Saccharothrix deserti]|uniref:isopenicillin N synthase family dioxygenase n=1 Tax=Saccharothrix deserti TaxID=2593674 RepID=UPI00192E2FD2|nr:isopenicillin N synthase family oxygenase [Saccharothrix deserti]
MTTRPVEQEPPVTLVNGFVPVIDLGLPLPPSSPRRRLVADAIDRACQTSGFLVVLGHGVPDDLVNRLYAAAREFFALPVEAKRAIAADPTDTLQRGWESYLFMEKFCALRLGEEAGTPVTDRFGLTAPNRWPELAGFREVFLEYYRAMEDLAMELMRLLALSLDLPEDWFDDKFTDHLSPCALNYYVPQSRVAPGTLRNNPHTDMGTLTILYQDGAPGGLQVRGQDGEWLDVPAIPRSFVINLGRLMSRWTNGRLTSTVHRVVNPPEELAHLDRISIPFFHQPSPDALIECVPTCADEENPPEHEPILMGDYFVARSRRLFVQRRMSGPNGELPKGVDLL